MERLLYCDRSHNPLTGTGTDFSNFETLCMSLSLLLFLRFLSFFGILLQANRAAAVASLLRLSGVTHVDLSDCGIGSAGANELCSAFSAPTNLYETFVNESVEEDLDPVVEEVLRATRQGMMNYYYYLYSVYSIIVLKTQSEKKRVVFAKEIHPLLF